MEDDDHFHISRTTQTKGEYTEDMDSLLLLLEANKRKKKILRKQNVTMKVTLKHVMELVSKNLLVSSDSDEEIMSNIVDPQEVQKNNEIN